jgi:hypothetical protein
MSEVTFSFWQSFLFTTDDDDDMLTVNVIKTQKLCKMLPSVVIEWFGLESGYPDWGFCDFRQSLQVNAEIVL